MRHKVLFISSWFPNKLEPTSGNFVQRHAEAASLYHDVEVLHAVGDFNQVEKFVFEEEIINGVRTLIVYYKNSKNPAKNFLRRMAAYKKGFLMLQKPDLVHANVMHNSMLFAVFLKKKYKIPYVISEHWSGLQNENRNKLSFSQKLVSKYIARYAEFILPVSENLKSGLENLGIKTKMTVVANSVNTRLFSINKSEVNGFPVFLHVSSLIPLKNVPDIINAAKKLHDEGYRFYLKVGGDGDIEPLRNLVKQRNAEDFIIIFPEISQLEVAKMMQQSDCFVHFSDNETQGCVLLESLLCGKPVIAAAVGGIPEFMNDKLGILVQKNNTGQLYDAMKVFLNKKTSFLTPEEMRREISAKVSMEAVGKKFSEIYSKVL